MSIWFWYALMAVGLGGMVWCAKNQRRVANAQLYSVICLVVVAISAVMALTSFFGDGELEQSIENAKQFELAKVDQIADFVNKNHAGQKVVVLIKSDMLNPSEHQIDTLKEFSSRVQGQVTLLEPVVLQITDPSTLQPEDPESGEMPYIPSPEEELNAKKFNDKFKECKAAGADVVVNFAGMPAMPEDTQKLIIWRWGTKDPKVVLAEIMEMNFDPKSLLGPVSAFVASKPDAQFDYLKDTAPENFKEAFDLRYVIVTKENAPNVLDENGMVKSGLK